MKLAKKRFINFSLLSTVLLTVFIILQINSYSLIHNAFFTGWLLFSSICLLYLLNVRKKMVGLRLLKVSTWMQIHIYAGLFASVIFLLHTGIQIPEGLLKKILYFIFIAEALSGFFGLFISRILPPYLARSGAVLYPEIDFRQQQIVREIENLVEDSLIKTHSNTIARFYQTILKSRRHFWSHIVQSKKPLHKIENDINNLKRYLNATELEIIEQIRHLLIEKDHLDYQYAGQSLLKRWLFVHIPLSYALLLLSTLHVLLVYAYIGGI